MTGFLASLSKSVLIGATALVVALPLPQISVSLAQTSDVSRNWSGYSASGGTYTSVSGTWSVPELHTDLSLAADATWVGIGGVVDHDLIQGGTQTFIDTDGIAHREAFIERLPGPSKAIPLDVNAHDQISVSLHLISPDTWKFDFVNQTTGDKYQTTVTYHSSESSADWIEETPLIGRVMLPVADFGSVVFSEGSTTKDGVVSSIKDAGAKPVSMSNHRGQLVAIPSDLADNGTGFTVNHTDVPDTTATADVQVFSVGLPRMGFFHHHRGFDLNFVPTN